MKIKCLRHDRARRLDGRKRHGGGVRGSPSPKADRAASRRRPRRAASCRPGAARWRARSGSGRNDVPPIRPKPLKNRQGGRKPQWGPGRRSGSSFPNAESGADCRRPSARRIASPGSGCAAPSACGRLKRLCSRASRSVTLMRGWAATRRADSSRSANGAMPSTGFSGFCGETSHQISSSASSRSASRLIWRWPRWAGLKEPPSSPTRRCRRSPRAGGRSSRAEAAGAGRGQGGDPYPTTRSSR